MFDRHHGAPFVNVFHKREFPDMGALTDMAELNSIIAKANT